MHPPDLHRDHITSAHKKARTPRAHLTTRKALVLSSITFAAGIWISLQTSNWSWFSRSGSLIVIIGIFLTSSQIIENSRRLKKRRSHFDNNFHRDFADDLKQRTLEKSRVLEEDIWANGLRGLYLLVSGTLIWGFGDLIGLLLN